METFRNFPFSALRITTSRFEVLPITFKAFIHPNGSAWTWVQKGTLNPELKLHERVKAGACFQPWNYFKRSFVFCSWFWIFSLSALDVGLKPSWVVRISPWNLLWVLGRTQRKKMCMEKPNWDTEVVKHAIAFRAWGGTTLNSPECRELQHCAFISI